MLSKTFFFMIIFSFISAVFTGNVGTVALEFSNALSDAVNLCISLCGMMCFWSGLMNVLKDAGVLGFLSKFIKPVIRLIYGKKASEGENIDNLSASFAANFLGLGNASLPLGIRAVKGFEKDNKSSSASDSTVMFCVLATVPFQLIPSTLIALRTKYNSINPYDVVPYIWICSVVIILFAVVTCKVLSRFWRNNV